MDVFIDNAIVLTQTDLDPVTPEISRIGALDQSGTPTRFFNGIIANLKITDGTTLTHDLAFDEDFATTSIAVNIGSIGAAGNATAVNITDSELFTLHTETDPDEWRNFDDTIIIPIAPQA